MVEAAGIEPASESRFTIATTCVARPLKSRRRDRVGPAVPGCQAKSILSGGVFATLRLRDPLSAP